MTAKEFVAKRLADGLNPNDIEREIDDAILATDWALWGDDVWRLDKVCPKCGSGLPRICGFDCKPCTEEAPILRREYEARKKSAIPTLL